MNQLFVLFVIIAGGLFYFNQPALASVAVFFALVVLWRNKDLICEKYEDMVTQQQTGMMSINDNTVPPKEGAVVPNRANEYVPYTLSPYLATKYENGNIQAYDKSFSGQTMVQTTYTGAMDMNPFKDNKASPQACLEGNAMYSTDMGCVKLTQAQLNQFSGRSGNSDTRAVNYI